MGHGVHVTIKYLFDLFATLPNLTNFKNCFTSKQHDNVQDQVVVE